MRKQDVESGAIYLVKVSGKLTRVRILRLSPFGAGTPSTWPPAAKSASAAPPDCAAAVIPKATSSPSANPSGPLLAAAGAGVEWGWPRNVVPQGDWNASLRDH